MKRRIILSSITLLVTILLIISNTPYRNASKLVNAIKNEDYKRVEQLLKDGVNPNITTTSKTTEFILNIMESSGERPLSVACEVGNLDIVQLLINYGATAEPLKNWGWSPLREVLFYYQQNDVDIVKLLLENGADPNYHEHRLPVFIAAAMQPKVYDKEKRNGTVFAGGYDEDTAKGITQIVEILLADKSLNIKTPSGETLLIIAVKSENIYLVNYLYTAGCDVNIVDNNGKTAYDYAIQSNNKDIISILEE